MRINNDINSMSVVCRIAEMERERYESTGDYSVTSIITPPRIVRLQKRYAHLVPLNPESMIASMTGTAVHEYAEKYLKMWIALNNYKEYTLEEELAVNLLDRRITGRYDIRDGVHLYDIKNIKTWKLIFDPEFKEFHEQQNLYALLMHMDKGIDLETINILAFYKDWTEGTAARDRHYPQSPVVEYGLDLWDYEKTDAMLMERLQMHIDCEDMADDDLPMCTRDDRWERHPGGEPVHYAIMKKPKAKRATRVVKGGNLDGALKVANALPGMTKDSFIEVRYSKPKRCLKYCNINSYCKFWKYYSAKKGKVDEQVKFKV